MSLSRPIARKLAIFSPPPLRGRSASEASREGGKPRVQCTQFTPHRNPPPQGGRELTGLAARFVTIFLFAFLISCGAYSSAFAQSPQFTPGDEAPETFPAGAGRDEAFFSCTACHNFKLVAAQGLSRRQWDESIALMVAKHGMPVLDDKEKKIVLDYLETAFPPRAPSSGGWQNPFLKQ